jgi:1-deoxy-D-xylulose-5-phosphate reductoisomerase
MRRISIFGATGSIGQSTVDLIRRAGGAQAFDCVALTGGANVALLAQMARELRADIAVTAHESALDELRAQLAGSGIAAAAGPAALIEAAQRPADWVMSAIVGNAGLAPGFAALKQGAGLTLALANKESLVSAGPLLLARAAQAGARILPVDSEHSAIFQALAGEDMAAVESVTITASGGALRDWPYARLASASVADVSTHPNWAMGQRITIDSASMFNKAMEVIEAREFFGLRPDQIRVLIHPQSAVHALVGFVDGAVMAHLGAPDMRHAIGYALNWPQRRALPVARLDLGALGALTFAAPDLARYPALALGRAVMATGGAAGAVFTAAKEAALDAFLAGQIGFMDMAAVVEAVLERMAGEMALAQVPQSLDIVLQIDHLSRIRAAEAAAQLCSAKGP